MLILETDETITFNFDQGSENFIRNAFSTDPTSFDSTLASYFLGETFESQVQELTNASTSAGLFAFFAGLGDGTTNVTKDWSDFRSELTAAQSGWFIGTQTQQKKLFRLVALDDGEQFQKITMSALKILESLLLQNQMLLSPWRSEDMILLGMLKNIQT